MLQLYTRKKIQVSVPENITEDKSTRFTIEDIQKAKNYYDENGYVIFSKCVDPDHCDFLRNLWDKSIKQYNGKIYRQTTGKAEKNIFNENKWIMNTSCLLFCVTVVGNRLEKSLGLATRRFVWLRCISGSFQCELFR